MRKKRWRNRKGAGLLALALALALALSGTGAMETRAAIAVDVNAECTLAIDTQELYDLMEDDYQKSETKPEGVEVTVDLFKVAVIDESGRYTPTGLFAGNSDLANKLASINSETDENFWKDLSSMLTQAITDGNGVVKEEPDHTGTAGEGEYVKFEGLDTGMYLVVPRQVTTYFYMYNFTPYLVSLPHNYYDPDKTDSSDEWVYTVEMGLKPGREERYGSIKIMKELTEMSMMPGNEATFVFQVDIETLKGDKYQEMVSMTFDGTDPKEVVIEQIPAGSTVRVEEVYSGAGYEIADGSSYIWSGKELPANDKYGEGPVVDVKFVNQPDGTTTGGYGIENHFTVDGNGQPQYQGPNGPENEWSAE